MSFFQAIILAIVEGITEFLPISSTGHLVLVATLLQIEQTNFVKSFEIIIQLGAILAVVVLYFQLLRHNVRLWKTLLIAFFPSMIVGLLFYKLIKGVFIGNPYITLIALFVGGIVILFFEKRYKETSSHTGGIEHIDKRQAIYIGLCQSLSVVPGVSRAAATIVGGMYAGLSRKASVEFSFLLAVPTMLAASALDLTESYSSFSPEDISLLITGFVVSFIVAILSIKWLLKFIRTNTLAPFGIYRIALSVLYYFFVLR